MVKVRLQPLVRNINLPTVITTAILPGDYMESIFIATQPGEIIVIRNGEARTFLDLRQRVLKLGTENGGYDERGLVGLAFHPWFHYNGLFYLHYSVRGTEGPGALPDKTIPNPCDQNTLHLKWDNRDERFDHIDTVEEWKLKPGGQVRKLRTLLNLRRPFFNHNGVNSLHFSPETGRLVFVNGDGGSGYDPFNLSQNDLEIAGKIIEINVDQSGTFSDPPIVTRFNELPVEHQKILTVIAKGVRNSPGISFQRHANGYIKYVGIVGQDLAETIFSFSFYNPLPVTRLIHASSKKTYSTPSRFINFGWRAWEGAFPTMILKKCQNNPDIDEKTIAFYQEAVNLSITRTPPLISYFHQDSQPNRFAGTALTGVKAYMGSRIPELTGTVVFIDLLQKGKTPARGVLAYTIGRLNGRLQDFYQIDIKDGLASQAAYFTSLGTNINQTRLFLGVYQTLNVTDPNKGIVYEILPG